MKKCTTLFHFTIVKTELVVGEPLFYWHYAILDLNFGYLNIMLLDMDIDLCVISVDDTKQPAFINDPWNVQRLEDEQQQAKH